MTLPLSGVFSFEVGTKTAFRVRRPLAGSAQSPRPKLDLLVPLSSSGSELYSPFLSLRPDVFRWAKVKKGEKICKADD